MGLRRLWVAGIAMLAAAAPGLVVPGSQVAADGSVSTLGQFSTPFEEDPNDAKYNLNPDGTPITDRTAFTEHCYDANFGTSLETSYGQYLVCKPAGVTVAVLSSGITNSAGISPQIAYWNGLEGFENIKSNTTLEVARASQNDRARLMAL